MKTETLKRLIKEAASRAKDVDDLLDETLSLIQIYEDDQETPSRQMPQLPNKQLRDFRDWIPVKGNPGLVPYHTICSCNPANGGSGICGCVIANKMVDPNGGSSGVMSSTIQWPNSSSSIG
jgi:hypothetical protein